MKTYSVTLAQIAWIKGTIVVEADSYAEAFERAKADSDKASWPVDEDGDGVVGFTTAEVDRAYCEDESEPDHEGEPISADTTAYRAAPAMLAALKDIADLENTEANAHLAATGSYSMFGERYSVEKARDAIAEAINWQSIAECAGWAWDEAASEFRLNDTGDGYDNIWKGRADDWGGLCLAMKLEG